MKLFLDYLYELVELTSGKNDWCTYYPGIIVLGLIPLLIVLNLPLEISTNLLSSFLFSEFIAFINTKKIIKKKKNTYLYPYVLYPCLLLFIVWSSKHLILSHIEYINFMNFSSSTSFDLIIYNVDLDFVYVFFQALCFFQRIYDHEETYLLR